MQNLILNLFIISVLSLFQAQTKCVIQDDAYPDLQGQDCSKLVIDGTAAATSGYPQVTIGYDMQLCNFNSDFDMQFNANPDKRSYLEFFKSDDKTSLVTKDYNGVTDDALPPDACVAAIGTLNLDTTFARYYMKAQIQGPTTEAGVFCYAFAENPINVKYDYGFGECMLNVSALCFYTKTTLASNQNSNPFLIPAMS